MKPHPAVFEDLWAETVVSLGGDRAEALLEQAGQKLAAATARPFTGPIPTDVDSIPERQDEERGVAELPSRRVHVAAT